MRRGRRNRDSENRRTRVRLRVRTYVVFSSLKIQKKLSSKTKNNHTQTTVAAIIKKPTKNVSVSDALSHVLGYTVANDVSARRWQGKKGGGQWARAKSFDTFCPIGSELIVDVENPNEGQGLELKTVLNGEVMQHSSTSDMIYSVAEIVSFLSHDMTLNPGDIIACGTNSGLGPMTSGQIVTVNISSIGEVTNRLI